MQISLLVQIMSNLLLLMQKLYNRINKMYVKIRTGLNHIGRTISWCDYLLLYNII